MFIKKPWGSEELLETNEKYTFKKLTMLAGHKCSLQFHEFKHETFYVISGKMKFTYGLTADTLNDLILGPGDNFVIVPTIVHRMEAIEDCVYLEASTSELNDVIRLEDSYGR